MSIQKTKILIWQTGIRKMMIQKKIWKTNIQRRESKRRESRIHPLGPNQRFVQETDEYACLLNRIWWNLKDLLNRIWCSILVLSAAARIRLWSVGGIAAMYPCSLAGHTLLHDLDGDDYGVKFAPSMWGQSLNISGSILRSVCWYYMYMTPCYKEQNIIERSLNLEPWRPFIFLPAFAPGRTFERALFIGGATLR